MAFFTSTATSNDADLSFQRPGQVGIVVVEMSDSAEQVEAAIELFHAELNAHLVRLELRPQLKHLSWNRIVEIHCFLKQLNLANLTFINLIIRFINIC